MAKGYAQKHYDNILALLPEFVDEDFTGFDILKALRSIHKGAGIDTVRKVLLAMSEDDVIKFVRYDRKNRRLFTVDAAMLAGGPDDEEVSGDDDRIAELDATTEDPEDWVIPAVTLDSPVDYDQSDNAPLHNLYVGTAMEDLQAINEAIETFESKSRWPASLVVTDLILRRRHLIMTNSAYFDAAAYLLAGFTAQEFQEHHGNYSVDLDNDDMV